MSGARTPDPTLAALGPMMVAVDQGQWPPVAHSFKGRRTTTCGRRQGPSEAVLNKVHAAYIAVPCRECFPDAPLPGRRDDCLHGLAARLPGADHVCDPHLAWQVTA